MAESFIDSEVGFDEFRTSDDEVGKRVEADRDQVLQCHAFQVEATAGQKAAASAGAGCFRVARLHVGDFELGGCHGQLFGDAGDVVGRLLIGAVHDDHGKGQLASLQLQPQLLVDSVDDQVTAAGRCLAIQIERQSIVKLEVPCAFEAGFVHQRIGADELLRQRHVVHVVGQRRHGHVGAFEGERRRRGRPCGGIGGRASAAVLHALKFKLASGTARAVGLSQQVFLPENQSVSG